MIYEDDYDPVSAKNAKNGALIDRGMFKKCISNCCAVEHNLDGPAHAILFR